MRARALCPRGHDNTTEGTRYPNGQCAQCWRDCKVAADATRREARKAVGVCAAHPTRPAVSATRCRECLERDASNATARNRARKADGSCIKHPDRKAVSETMCQECLDYLYAYGRSFAGATSHFYGELRRRAARHLAQLEELT